MTLYEELEWRGLVYDATEGARDALALPGQSAYIGFDPTAASLHAGSLLPVLALARLQRFGHRPIALVGGGTGLIGDPSGKSQERALMTVDEVEANVAALKRQLGRFLEFGDGPTAARLLNNAEWLRGMDLMTFLRDVGKHFTINHLLAKESIRRRVEGAEGISYTEFSYVLLQAYDFLMLYERHGCTMQLGGSDQWGNITAGCDLIRRAAGGKAHGVVMPLVTTATGAKFGKTEAGTVWLDPSLTSPFKFYQFWLNTDDRDAARYLKYFTFLPQDRIRALEETLASQPERREAQRVLAREMTELAHGRDAVERAERASALLFGRNVREASKDEILMVFEDVPSTEIDPAAFPGGIPIARLAVETSLEPSSSAAVRLIKGGGLYLNDERVTDERGRVTPADAIDGEILVLRKGQRERRIVRFKAS